MLTSGKVHQIAVRTSLIYAVVAGAWIYFSDHALVALVGHHPDLVHFEVYKGMAFVVVTALLLYGMLRAQFYRAEQAAEAKRATEAELRMERERLRCAVNAAQIGIWEYDLTTGTTYFSPEWKRQIGYADHELANTQEEWSSRIHPDDRERLNAALAAYLQSPTGPWHLEFRLRHRDGTYRWILSQGSMQYDAAGKPTRVLGSHVDITKLKDAEVVLRERAAINDRLAHIAAVVPGAILAYEERPDGTRSCRYASPTAKEVYGFSAEECVEDVFRILKRVVPEDLPRLERTMAECAQSGTTWHCEFQYDHPVKGVVWLEAFAVPERRPDAAIYWNGFVMDVTERKRVELRVQQLNRLYAVLSDINQTIVRVREPQLLFEAVCRVAVEKGRFRMAWIARVDQERGLLVPAAHAGVTDGYLDDFSIDLKQSPNNEGPSALAVRTGQHVICTDIANDERMAPWRAAALARGYRAGAALPIRSHGSVVGVLNLYASEPNVFDAPELQLLDEMAVDLSFALEVSEGEQGRLRTEASWRENEERFRQLAENIHEVFWLTDPASSRILYVSPVYERVWGRTVESLYAHPSQWTESIHVEDRAKVKSSLERQASGTYDEEYRIVRGDGAIRWIRARAFPVRDHRGGVYRIAGIAEDITDRKSLEEQFFRAQRLEAIGTLASGIAHDLNNILAPIMMCAPMLRMGLPATEFEKMLGTIEASTRRGADLVRQLLVFGRGVEGGRGPVAPKSLVGEMLKIASQTFPKNIAVKSTIPNGLWDMIGDATQLHQVLLNLCVNARDAMPDGGELIVEAENVEVDPKRTPALADARPGPYVRLRVKDSGTGIPPENIEKIFDPFFTTKPPGKGTGLGLSTVLGIVKSHGGLVRLKSTIGEGTCFDVYIPAQYDSASAAPGHGSASAPHGNQELILLVEDEASIREVVADILSRQNYRVMVADDGVEGEMLFRENIDEIALIITDLDMPRMDGLRMIKAVRHLRNAVPIVVSTGLRSGRPTQERATELEDLGVAAVLAKPFATNDILTAVHTALTKPLPPSPDARRNGRKA